MSLYQVSFFKYLLSSDGHQFKSLQQSIVIRSAKSTDRAVEAAKRRYERRCHVPIGRFMRTPLSWRPMAKHLLSAPPSRP